MSDNIYNSTALETVKPAKTAKVKPTPEEATAIAIERNRIFREATKLIDTPAIQKQARRLRDMGLYPVLILPTDESIQDELGETHWYKAVGKKPMYKGWPAAALDVTIKPEDYPGDSNLGILCGTEVVKDGRTYWVCDIDIDLGSVVYIFVRVFAVFGLPRAFIWGHAGKPCSHHLFLLDRPTFSDTKLCGTPAIAEIRCQTKDGIYVPCGNQSMTFPSVWCKGDKFEVVEQDPDSAPEPPIVSCDLLIKAYRTAVAVIRLLGILPPPPHYNIRNAFFRIAAEGKLPKEEALRFINLVEEFSRTSVSSNSDVESEADNIYGIVAKGMKSNTGEDVHLYGLPKLLEWIGEANRTTFNEILQLLGIESKPQSTGHRKYHELDDMGNGERFTEKFSDVARYCGTEKCWYVWGKDTWSPDHTNLTLQNAKSISGDIKHEALQMKTKDNPTKEEQEMFAAKKKAYLAWAARCGMAERWRAMLTSASAIPEMQISSKDFDRHPHLLNCKNGVVDLYTGQLTPHDRNLYLTQLCPIEYDPTAKSKDWDTVLDTITRKHPDLREFLQTLCGYIAQGRKTQEWAIICYGPGGTGKGTFWSVIQKVLGPDYARSVSPDTILSHKRNGGAASGDILRLRGSRLALTSEFEQNSKLDEGRLKSWIGSDTITARALYGKEEEFVSQFQIVLQTNRRPKFDATDTGNQRRYIELPFDNVIADDPNVSLDVGLKARLLEDPDVLRAVLAWLVAGCMRWKTTGLIKPDCVVAATKELLRTNDEMGDFAEDSLIVDPDATTLISKLRDAYMHWTLANRDFEPLKDRDFNQQMEGRGFKRGQKKTIGKNEKVWFGVRLTESARRSIQTEDEKLHEAQTAYNNLQKEKQKVTNIR